jgi:hypothetical protein
MQSKKHVDASSSNVVTEVMSMFLKHQETTQDQHFQQNKEILNLVKSLLTAAAPPPTPLLAAAPPPPPLQNVMLENTTNNSSNNSNSNNNNNNNQSFNLQFFLNEECKNAMNFSDFVQNLSVSFEDIQHLGEVGYTAGMSKIITNALRDSKVRPMHCTDAKRETMYVKENNEWRRDTECEESKRLIQKITQKNYKTLAEWRATLPDQLVHDSEPYETWFRMSRSMCNTDPAALKKLIRHLASVTAIEKNTT